MFDIKGKASKAGARWQVRLTFVGAHSHNYWKRLRLCARLAWLWHLGSCGIRSLWVRTIFWPPNRYVDCWKLICLLSYVYVNHQLEFCRLGTALNPKVSQSFVSTAKCAKRHVETKMVLNVIWHRIATSDRWKYSVRTLTEWWMAIPRNSKAYSWTTCAQRTILVGICACLQINWLLHMANARAMLHRRVDANPSNAVMFASLTSRLNVDIDGLVVLRPVPQI